MAEIADFSQYFDAIKQLIQPMIANNLTSSNNLKKSLIPLNEIIEHVHSTHEHPCCHTYDGKTNSKNYKNRHFTDCNQNCFDRNYYPDDTFSLPELLLQEASLERDCDGNNLIFLKHFIFYKNDNEVPKALKAVQRIQELHNLIIPRYTWKDYLTTFIIKNIYV